MKAVMETEENAAKVEKLGCRMRKGPRHPSGLSPADSQQSTRTRHRLESQHGPQVQSVRVRPHRAISDTRSQLATFSEDNLTKVNLAPSPFGYRAVPSELSTLVRSASVPASTRSPSRSVSPMHTREQQLQAGFGAAAPAYEVFVGGDQRAELIQETSQLFGLECEVIETLLNSWYAEKEKRFNVAAVFGWLLDHGWLPLIRSLSYCDLIYDPLTCHPFSLVGSFTGSSPVGWGTVEEERTLTSPTTLLIVGRSDLSLMLCALKLDLQLYRNNKQRRYTSRFPKAFRSRSRSRRRLSTSRA
jgi:hypothetical protein